MNAALRSLLVLVRGACLAGFVVGGIHAAVEISRRDWVREFQAGPPSPLSERAWAVALRAAVEGVGFGGLALVLGGVAVLLAALARHARAPRGAAPATSFGRQVAAHLVLCGLAFVLWNDQGTWIADEAMPFLYPLELLALNAAGVALAILALHAFHAIALRIPPSPREEPAAVALAAIGSLWLAQSTAIDVLREGEGSWRTPGKLAMAASCFAVALPLTAVLARAIRGPVAALSERLADRPLLPRRVTLPLVVAFLLCAAVTRPFLGLGGGTASAAYPRLEPRGAPAGPNVLVVTIDTLRADHLGCYGYPRPTSPFLDSLAAEGTLCVDPVASASWTKPATGTLLTGLYPSRHGGLYHGSSLQLPEGHRTLAEAFQEAGYVTAGFVTNANIKAVFDFDRGFDEYFDSPAEDTVAQACVRDSMFGGLIQRFTNYQFNWKFQNDAWHLNEQIEAWVDTNRDNRFFLYVHYVDPHIPYDPPADLKREFARDHEGLPLFNDRKRLVGVDLYDAEIRDNDDALAALFAHLEDLGLADDLLVVVTSDHGEEFFEHGVLGHGFSLYQEVIRVPLIFHGPGVARGRRIEAPTELVDMPATLLDLAGTGATELGDGRSFAAAVRPAPPAVAGDGAAPPDALAPEPYYVESEFGKDEHDIRSFVMSSVRRGPWKLVMNEKHAYRPPDDPRYGAYELYNLEQDPDERHNRFHEPELRPLVEKLLAELQGHAEFLDETGFRNVKPASLSPEMRAQLEALGYLGGE